jgi:hypothetical protein
MIDDKSSSIIAQASPDELKQIRMFKRRAEKLLNNSLVQQGFNSSTDLRISNEDGPSFSSFQLPPEEAFESLLMRFRHFWLQDEPCKFFNILNIVGRRVPEARDCTKTLKTSWKKGLFHSTTIVIDNAELTSERIIDLWLNSEFFHNDEPKKLELDTLIERIEESSNSPELLRFILIGSICECCRVIFDLNNLLKKIQFAVL